MNKKLIEFFDVPKEAYSCIELMLTEEEIVLIENMQDQKYTYKELLGLIEESFADLDSEDFIRMCYKRGIINKEIVNGEIIYKSADVYTRLAYFAQYESKKWKSIPKEVRKNLDDWYVRKYTENAIPRLEEIEKGTRKLIENAYFYTLEETLILIDEIDEEIYMVPCNCKSVALNCDKPKNVCIQFDRGINTEWDRGWGKSISKEKAKEIVIMANKKGLMHTSETKQAICNCDGCCCYPIRASRNIQTKGIWPKKRYDIVWNKEKCIGCGICSNICNFNAFSKKGKTISFDENKCWGCTICKDHCPAEAITIEKIEN
ncbi:4Fe-4S binding protein [Maledivibacter halophilus]|uniref:4Fe-4S dicluster domain-containing protein n=1 Tax=Maledivibacter halophilus TaxID=36842 RepID=A0A1T5LL38_9FIRM|nr:4Fe-4S binding protein [Maledivibacter halophilus]SKC76515.1 4Fe-4S dicluster domain-containing protein [Maledivibacter halophilus]